jgi:hypothetical protein
MKNAGKATLLLVDFKFSDFYIAFSFNPTATMLIHVHIIYVCYYNNFLKVICSSSEIVCICQLFLLLFVSRNSKQLDFVYTDDFIKVFLLFYLHRVKVYTIFIN